jgi:putative transposase
MISRIKVLEEKNCSLKKMYLGEKLNLEIMSRALEKMVRTPLRREMAKKEVADRGICMRVTCVAFRISNSCCRYVRKLDAEIAEVANCLFKLTDTHRNWGLGLCYFYLLYLFRLTWNHK